MKYSSSVLFHIETRVCLKYFVHNCSFFGQLLRQNSYFLVKQLVQNKDIYRRAAFLRQVLLHSINIFRIDTFLTKTLLQRWYFFRTVTFWKKLIIHKSNIPQYFLFLESHFFRAATFCKDLTIHSSYYFRRATFSQHTFPGDVLFENYTSFPQLQLLFIS